MKFTDKKFLDFINSGKTGKVYHIAPHKILEDQKKYITLSSFNFNGTPGNNIYCLDVAEDLRDYSARIVSIILNKNMSANQYRAYLPCKSVKKNAMVSINKDQLFEITQRVGLEYPLVANFFLWNQI